MGGMNGGEPLALNEAHSETEAPTASDVEFRDLLAAVERAAHEWGVRADSLEWRFVSAVMGVIEWSGRVSAGAQAEFKRLFRQHREATE